MMKSPVGRSVKSKKPVSSLKKQRDGFFSGFQTRIDHIPFYKPKNKNYSDFCTFKLAKNSFLELGINYFDHDAKKECLDILTTLNEKTAEEKNSLISNIKNKIHDITYELHDLYPFCVDLPVNEFVKLDRILRLNQKALTWLEFYYYYNCIHLRTNPDLSNLQSKEFNEKLIKSVITKLMNGLLDFILNTNTSQKIQNHKELSGFWKIVFAICETLRRSTVLSHLNIKNHLKTADYLKVLLIAYNNADINHQSEFDDIYKRKLICEKAQLEIERFIENKGGVFYMSPPESGVYETSGESHLIVYEDKVQGGFFYKYQKDDTIEHCILSGIVGLENQVFDQTPECREACEDSELSEAVFACTSQRGHTKSYTEIEKDYFFSLYTYYHVTHIYWLPVCIQKNQFELVQQHFEKSFHCISLLIDSLFYSLSNLGLHQIEETKKYLTRIEELSNLSEQFVEPLSKAASLFKNIYHLKKTNIAQKNRILEMKKVFSEKEAELTGTFVEPSETAVTKEKTDKTVSPKPYPTENATLPALLSNPLKPVSFQVHADEYKPTERIPEEEQKREKEYKKKLYDEKNRFVMFSSPDETDQEEESKEYTFIYPCFLHPIKIFLDHDACRNAMGDEAFEEILPKLNAIMQSGYPVTKGQGIRVVSQQEAKGLNFEGCNKGSWFKLAPFGDQLRIFGKVVDNEIHFKEVVYQNAHKKLARMKKT